MILSFYLHVAAGELQGMPGLFKMKAVFLQIGFISFRNNIIPFIDCGAVFYGFDGYIDDDF